MHHCKPWWFLRLFCEWFEKVILCLVFFFVFSKFFSSPPPPAPLSPPPPTRSLILQTQAMDCSWRFSGCSALTGHTMFAFLCLPSVWDSCCAPLSSTCTSISISYFCLPSSPKCPTLVVCAGLISTILCYILFINSNSAFLQRFISTFRPSISPFLRNLFSSSW